MAAAKDMHGHSFLRSATALLDVTLPEWLRQPLRQGFGKASASPDWLDTFRLGAQPIDPYAPKATSIFDLSKCQLQSTNLPMLLHWEDRDSMAHSVEARVPFLDHRLVEFVLGLPDDYKLSKGTTKRVFRDAMGKLLPDAIRERRDKIGFATPEEVWMLRVEPEAFRTRIQNAVEQSRGILRPCAVALFDEMRAGKRQFNFTPWRMISLGTWMERFAVQT
jgi:asparagine synthase (glutamine-hydrolysing)